jgi:hypothetical protein
MLQPLKNYTSTVTLWLDKIFPHLASPTEQLATCRATTVTFVKKEKGSVVQEITKADSDAKELGGFCNMLGHC